MKKNPETSRSPAAEFTSCTNNHTCGDSYVTLVDRAQSAQVGGTPRSQIRTHKTCEEDRQSFEWSMNHIFQTAADHDRCQFDP